MWPFKVYSIDEQWQHNACTTLGLLYVISNRLRPGGSSVDIAHFLLGHHIPPQYSSVQDYMQDMGMDQPHIWDTEIEILHCSIDYNLVYSYISLMILTGIDIPLIM